MNVWMLASLIVLAGIPPCGWVALTGSVPKRLVAMEMAGVLCTLELMLLAVAFGRLPMMDLPLALAIMSFGSGMLFAHFLAMHL